MTRFPRAALLLLLLGMTPVFAQSSSSYSFDNFDTREGVKIHIEPPAKPLKASASKKRQLLRTAAPNPIAIQSTVILTSLNYESTANVGASNSALRGFTTGNSRIDEYLVDSANRNGVDPLLLYSIMHQESSFKLRAISPKGARGLMQLMPGTAARYGVTNIFDPRQNIEGGARYVRFLLDLFDGDVNLTLAGYNAGEGAVEKYGWQVPPYAETQEYVRRISRRYNLLRDPNAALYASSLSRSQLAQLQAKQSIPLNIYERTVQTVRLPDGRLQLISQ